LHSRRGEPWALVTYEEHPPTLIHRAEGRISAQFQLPHPPTLAAFQKQRPGE
jgi:arginine/lysine/ornithine decarboxylase